jgi:hypothetical protein
LREASQLLDWAAIRVEGMTTLSPCKAFDCPRDAKKEEHAECDGHERHDFEHKLLASGDEGGFPGETFREFFRPLGGRRPPSSFETLRFTASFGTVKRNRVLATSIPVSPNSRIEGFRTQNTTASRRNPDA